MREPTINPQPAPGRKPRFTMTNPVAPVRPVACAGRQIGIQSGMRTCSCVLLIGLVLGSVPTLPAHPAVAEDMRVAAVAWLDALAPAQRAAALYPFDHNERENWNFVPVARRGLPVKEMDAMQQARALAFLRTGLSAGGLAQAQAVMALELVLRELERGAAHRDPTLYFVTIFGEPSATASWGWRFEGHHLSFNFTVVEGREVVFAPSFLGSNPAEVRQGPRRGERVLAGEEDLALAFINALTPEQRRLAVFAEKALPEIVTGNQRRVQPLEPRGISAAQLSPPQREELLALVQLYLDRWRGELAAETRAEIIAAGVEQITFAWAGGFSRAEPRYYRVQGPTFLIEFDNFQGGGNHIHTAFREFRGDFGHDLLRVHHQHDHAPAHP